MMPPSASMAFAVGLPDRKQDRRVAKKRLGIEAKHRIAVEGKKEKVAMLKALVEEWVSLAKAKTKPTEADLAHLRDLKRRLRTAEAQLAAMRP